MNDNDLKIVRVTNISNFDFTGELGARYGGRDFVILAGKSLLVPFTLGDHLAKHLAQAILIKGAPVRDASQTDGKGSDRPLWDDASITILKGKIMSEVYEEEAKPALSEPDRMAAKVRELNKVMPPEETNGGNTEVSGLVQADDGAGTTVTYKDKADVIAELNKRGVKFDARSSKVTLEGLLN